MRAPQTQSDRSADFSRLTLCRLLWCLAALAPATLLGANAEAGALHVEAPSLGFSVIRVAGALALVFALFLGGVWLFRNWQRLALQRGRAPKLNVLEVKSLGPRHALYVVGYEQQRFLLSSAPTGISMLTTLPPAASAETEAQSQPQPSFADTLARALAPSLTKRGVLPG
jgi:flagellar biogenesis protein FliO